MDRYSLKQNKSCESNDSKYVEAAKNRRRYINDDFQVKPISVNSKIVTNKKKDENKKKTNSKNASLDYIYNSSLSSDSCSSVEFEWKSKNKESTEIKKSTENVDRCLYKESSKKILKKSESLGHKAVIVNKIDKSSSFENVSYKNIQNSNFLMASNPVLEVHSDTRNKSPINLNRNYSKNRKKNRSRATVTNQNDYSSSDYDDCLVGSLVRYYSDETLNRANSKIKLRTQRYYQRKSHEFIAHPILNASKKLNEPKSLRQFSDTESLSSPTNTTQLPSNFVTFDWIESGVYSNKNKPKLKTNQIDTNLDVNHEKIHSTNPLVDFTSFDDILPSKASIALKKEKQLNEKHQTLNSLLSITTITSHPPITHFSPTNDSGVSSQSLTSSPIFNLPPSPPFRPTRHLISSASSSSLKNNHLPFNNVSSNQLINDSQRSSNDLHYFDNIYHLPPFLPSKNQSLTQSEKVQTIKRSQRLSVKDMVANIEKGYNPFDSIRKVTSNFKLNCQEVNQDDLRRVSSASKIHDLSSASNQCKFERFRHNSFDQTSSDQKNLSQNDYFQNNCVSKSHSQRDYNHNTNNQEDYIQNDRSGYSQISYNQNDYSQNEFSSNLITQRGYVQNGNFLKPPVQKICDIKNCNRFNQNKVNNNNWGTNTFEQNINNFNNFVQNGFGHNEKWNRNNSESKPYTPTTTKEIKKKSFPLPPLKLPPTILNIKTSQTKPDKFLENAKYKPHPDKQYSNLDEAIKDLEKIYESLKLNDEDLLEKAERRDMPSKFQLMRLNSDYSISYDQNSNCLKQVSNQFNDTLNSPRNKEFDRQVLLDSIEAFLASGDPRNRYRAPPLRRSAIHDRVKDDLAFRKLNLNQKKDVKINSNLGNSTNSYLLYSNFYTPTVEVEEVFKDFDNEPDIDKDDLSYRKLIQSEGATVLPPHPPFGIPVGVTNLSTFNNYIRANLDSKERNKIYYRVKPKIPHLIKDDLAYRNYRNDLKDVNDTKSLSSPLLPITTKHVFNYHKKSFILK